jgi:hypothetical protein
VRDGRQRLAILSVDESTEGILDAETAAELRDLGYL